MIGAIMAKKAVAGGFEALNQHDLARFMSAWHDDAVFIYPGDVSVSGTYRGRQAIEGWFRTFLDRFPAIEFDVQDVCVRDIFAFGGTNVVVAHWDVKLTDREGTERQNTGVTLLTLKGGKAAQIQDFIFDLGEVFRANWGAA